jgi:tetratricopeptide (TPR) repeat protein
MRFRSSWVLSGALRRIASRLTALGLGVGLIVVAELLLRQCPVGDPSSAPDPFAGFSSSVPVFERAQRDDGVPVFRIASARAPRLSAEAAREDGHEFLVHAPPAGVRIFVVGESSAAGVPYPGRYAFSSWIRSRLQAALPQVPIEVVNASFSGYSSRRLLLVARAIVEHEPDAVVLYLGHNEWAESRYYQHLIDLDPRIFRVWEWTASTRLYGLTARLLSIPRQRAGPEIHEVDFDPTRNSLEMFAVLRERAGESQLPSDREWAYRDLLYEHNLQEMGRLFRAAGALPIFLTLSQNFADWPPGASSHATAASAQELAEWERLRRRGDERAAARRCVEALDLYRQALEIDGSHADLHYRVASCHRELQQFEEARRHYRLASDLDRVPHGAPTGFNEIIRGVARRLDAPVVDVDAALASQSRDGLVGDDLFVDFIHPNLRAHQAIAAAVVDGMREARFPLPAGQWRETAYAEPDSETLLREDPELRSRELEMQIAACQLARRERCVRERAATLQRLDPENQVARRALRQIQ